MYEYVHGQKLQEQWRDLQLRKSQHAYHIVANAHIYIIPQRYFNQYNLGGIIDAKWSPLRLASVDMGTTTIIVLASSGCSEHAVLHLWLRQEMSTESCV